MRRGAWCVHSDGIGGTCRRIEQYTEPMLKFMCAVGAAPSAGGARAPIADIMSHMGTEVQKLSTTYITCRHSCVSYSPLQRNGYKYVGVTKV